MNVTSSWAKTPRERVAEECAHRGKDQVVAGCIELLSGRESDAELISALGGPPARWVLSGESPGSAYWLRVWAARGLLWAWDDVALESLEAALDDEAWRVREMALKVVARHGLEDALPAVMNLQDDPVARVRTGASLALMRLLQGRG